MKTKILIAMHKNYVYPSDGLYLPVQVGAAINKPFGITPDNTGDNISGKNPYFCELTAIYWAWKNLDADAIGLVHYRRYFKGNLPFEANAKTKKVLSLPQLDKVLQKNDVVLPKKRRYYIETLYSHYAHTMFVEPLDITGEIIRESYPDYYPEFMKLKKRRSAHMFNMFVMKRELFNNYCVWLFDILFKLEQRVDVGKYSTFHARFFGRVSELLLDVYLRTNKITFLEVGVENIEKVNMFKKITSFLKAKFTKQKYDKSF